MGTSKGLIVLDTKKNMLVQVVGSDNKLLSEYILGCGMQIFLVVRMKVVHVKHDILIFKPCVNSR